jgi:hypothetical protein
MRIIGRPTRFRGFLLLVLIIGMIAIGVWVVRMQRQMREGSSPWFGRGSSLAELPYTVIVGPVDSVKGIPGLVEIGMQRHALMRNIGSPLIAGMSIEEAEKKGFIDPEDVSADFLGGVFAWVQYDYRHAVQSITFDLRAFNEKFGGRQKVLLAHHGQTYLLGEELSQSRVIALFRDRGVPNVRAQGSIVVIGGTGVSLRFDDGGRHLESVSI